jgi:hypothetical protein
LTVYCEAAPGCRSMWFRPRHEPGTLPTWDDGWLTAGKGKAMKIETLNVAAQFTEDGSHAERAGGFDVEAVDDGPVEALLLYDDGRWELFTSEEASGSSHGYLQATDLAEAVKEARRRLQSEGYEVAFKVHTEDPD